jgi:hypothetical protein
VAQGVGQVSLAALKCSVNTGAGASADRSVALFLGFALICSSYLRQNAPLAYARSRLLHQGAFFNFLIHRAAAFDLLISQPSEARSKFSTE